jgi:hypothetical protein
MVPTYISANPFTLPTTPATRVTIPPQPSS